MLTKSVSLSSPKTARMSPGKRSLRESFQAQLSLHHPRDTSESIFSEPKAHLECEISSKLEPLASNNVHHLLHSICQAFLRS